MNAGNIYDYINEIAPFSAQAEWDNSGFQVGERGQEVKKVLLALDPTAVLIQEAKDLNCEMIITHHPVLFHPAKQFTEQNVAYLAARAGITVLSAHTSYDCADAGVSDVLAKTVGLQNIYSKENPFLRYGSIEPQIVKDFAESVTNTLHAAVTFNLPEKEIRLVAVCGGAGSDFWQEAKENGADLLLTGEAHHHEYLDSAAADMALMTAGHFETEFPAVKALQAKLQMRFPEIEFVLSCQIAPVQYTGFEKEV